jgi:cell division protein FtsQ
LLESKRVNRPSGSRTSRPMRLLTWLAPAVVLLILLGGGLFWFFRDHSAFHITRVRVYGAERVPQQELIQLARISRDTSLLRLNIERVRQRILQHPWVRDALVRRLFPSELEIIVYERRPAAILDSGPGYVIDAEGYLLGQATAAELASVPRLVTRSGQPQTAGARITEPAVNAGLRLLAQAHDNAFFRNTVITRIDIMSLERFLVQTQRGKFVVGADLTGLEEKLDFFPTIDEVLRTRARHVEYIDVSVANQIVVKTSARTTQGSGRLQRRGVGSGQAH